MAARLLALVTGASAGIGAEFARQLAAAGYDLVLTARRRERLDELAAELSAQYGAECQVIPADLALAEAPAQIRAAVEATDRSIDLLVNNAGFAIAGHYHATSWDDQARFIQVMVTAVAELSHQMLPAMRLRHHGAIINVASLAGIVPGSAGHTLYAASKAFLIKFSESLAMENADRGIRIQALCPGFTYSEFHDVVGTRDIFSQLPRSMWMQAEEVVSFSLRELARRNGPVVAVPGRTNRLIAALSRKLPYRTVFDLVRRRSASFRRQD